MLKQKGPILLVVGVILLTVLLFLIPRTPPNEIEISESEETINKALVLVRGEAPMQGILMLRELAEKEPDNIDAQWHLGVLSVESRQFEKAIERFENVCTLDKADEPKYKEAYFYLGNLYANLSRNEKAIDSFERLLKLNPDEELRSETEGLIKQLNND
ncbi:MAG: tetratricopeptide repeat protein [Flavobacteriales bacterium]|nr:tetratricopeptide repeat protein [Flavobacteriales bacterium]